MLPGLGGTILRCLKVYEMVRIILRLGPLADIGLRAYESASGPVSKAVPLDLRSLSLAARLGSRMSNYRPLLGRGLGPRPDRFGNCLSLVLRFLPSLQPIRARFPAGTAIHVLGSGRFRSGGAPTREDSDVDGR